MTDLIPESAIGIIIALVAGILLGALVCAIPLIVKIGRLRMRVALLDTQLNGEAELQRERERLLRSASEDLAVGLERSAARSMRSQGELLLQLAEAQLGKHHQKADLDLRERQIAIEALVKPLKETIDKTRQQVAHMENERREAYGSLQSHLSLVAESQNLLRQETRNLVGALRRPEVRGQWGEITLRRVVELAGMKEYCDFETQAQVDKPNSRLRPDMVVRLPDERVLVIDVKTPLDAYLDAVEARDESERDTAVSRHARIMRERVKELASKEYWSRFHHSPEFVVMFVPGDQYLAAALDRDPGLQEDALRQKVLLATPTTLIGLLKVVAYGWGEMKLASNADAIRDLAEQLHRRLASFTSHLDRVGRHLDSSIDAYNRAIGSFRRNVLPGAKKFGELGVPVKDQSLSIDPVEKTARRPDPIDVESEQRDGKDEAIDAANGSK